MNNKLPLDTRMLQQQAQSTTSVDREKFPLFFGNFDGIHYIFHYYIIRRTVLLF